MKQFQRRKHYRIHYPKRERPTLLMNGEDLEILDCSESGVKYKWSHDTPELGSLVRGRIRFLIGEHVEIEGVILRVEDENVCVQLTESSIPFKITLAEQRYLKKHYLGWAA